MSLKTPDKVEKLQKALHVKAKEEPRFRFYLLYDKVYRTDVLTHAYRVCYANGGAAGVDGETWQHYGEDLEDNLQELCSRLKRGAHRAKPVKRVYIPKADGRQRHSR